VNIFALHCYPLLRGPPPFPTRRSSDLAVLLVLATPLAAQQQAPPPKPWFLYLRDGGQSPLYLFASYSFGVPTVMIGTLVDTPHRSEEHTSELQSRGHLVCRLLLEKKKE